MLCIYVFFSYWGRASGTISNGSLLLLQFMTSDYFQETISLKTQYSQYTPADTSHFVANPIGKLNITVIYQSLHAIMSHYYNAKLVHILLYNKSGNMCSSFEYTLYKFVFLLWFMCQIVFGDLKKSKREEAAEWCLMGSSVISVFHQLLLLWLYTPFLALGLFFSFLILYTVGRTNGKKGIWL
jgi:hypothetical protein